MTDEEGAARLWAWDVGSTPDMFARYAGVSRAKWVAMFRLARGLLAAPALPAEPPAGFVRVRIAVRVEGPYWFALGSSMSNGDGAARELVGHGAEPFRISFVTADVPLPAAPAEVVGRVERSDAAPIARGGPGSAASASVNPSEDAP